MKAKELPPGFKDYVPREAKLKRIIEKKAADLFASWGYQEVITPTVEYLEVIQVADMNVDQQELFLFQNRDGRLLALRPDMTIPIARLASTKLRRYPLPLRLFYRANVFRHSLSQHGKYNEFWQIGVEMLGAAGERADAEVIALAVELMSCLGVEDFQLSLNNVRIFNQLLQESGLAHDDENEIKKLVMNKDLVGLERKLSGLRLDSKLKDTFLELPVLNGGLEVLERLPDFSEWPEVMAGVEELKVLFRALRAFGVEDRVVIDLGVLRGLDYYTGVVFEGYSSNLGYPLLGGGRYDNVMGRYGWPNPATGFAVGVERVLLALGSMSAPTEPCCLVAGSDLTKVAETARRLRKEGRVVCLDVHGRSRDELQAQCRQRGWELVWVDDK
ncbi:MAG: ATP phosphoribosyltransferase regulatory subunit [Syntrophothermus sp.]|uniref:ATP phosphoribosyltransferase regulatory subunit n=1 Tax=Syntrophothermus sp. TaxID=2736299 RepID=UPI00257CBBB0|nr:ATP phosphoribosyltransferase regulatory subunit [Syntrophothermus sp.]NSW82913.1 ATP phosphoribosyltransferase regulatory subunit [Syntrophothermus sp.]